MSEPGSRLPLEVTVVWVTFAVVATEILVTYSRIPPGELYHVSGSGLTGGASRALVFANFPTALAAIAIIGVLAPRLTAAGRAIAGVGAALCAAVAWPGVVDQANLDARPVNAIAALGVVVALALTLTVARGGFAKSPRRRTDGCAARSSCRWWSSRCPGSRPISGSSSTACRCSVRCS